MKKEKEGEGGEAIEPFFFRSECTGNDRRLRLASFLKLSSLAKRNKQITPYPQGLQAQPCEGTHRAGSKKKKRKKTKEKVYDVFFLALFLALFFFVFLKRKKMKKLALLRLFVFFFRLPLVTPRFNETKDGCEQIKKLIYTRKEGKIETEWT